MGLSFGDWGWGRQMLAERHQGAALHFVEDKLSTLQKVVKEAMLSVGFVCSLSNPGVLRHSKHNTVSGHARGRLFALWRRRRPLAGVSLRKQCTLKSKVLA